MFFSELSSSSVQLPSGAYNPELHSAWWNAAFYSLNCLSAASAVCQLPPAVRTSPPAFNVWSSGLLCGWPNGLELVIIWHWSWPETFFEHYMILKSFSQSISIHSALETLWLCVI